MRRRARLRVYFADGAVETFYDPDEVHVLNSGALRVETTNAVVLTWAPGRWTHTRSEWIS